jgi:hypothetical protein
MGAGLLAGMFLARPAARAKKWGQCPGWVRDLVDSADRKTRGKSSKSIMSMKIYKRGTTSMRMKTWSKGREKFLAKVRRPSRLRGMATLKSGDNLWNYLPRADRIVKLGSSMMGNSWMGSHFTNDDLVKETDFRKHYTCTGFKKWGKYIVVSAKPRPNAPVVWGKVVFKVRKKDSMPVYFKYYNERGKLERTLKFRHVRKMGGREIPTKMIMQPANAPSERTIVTFHKIRFNVSIPNRLFTLQGLKR